MPRSSSGESYLSDVSDASVSALSIDGSSANPSQASSIVKSASDGSLLPQASSANSLASYASAVSGASSPGPLSPDGSWVQETLSFRKEEVRGRSSEEGRTIMVPTFSDENGRQQKDEGEGEEDFVDRGMVRVDLEPNDSNDASGQYSGLVTKLVEEVSSDSEAERVVKKEAAGSNLTVEIKEVDLGEEEEEDNGPVVECAVPDSSHTEPPPTPRNTAAALLSSLTSSLSASFSSTFATAPNRKKKEDGNREQQDDTEVATLQLVDQLKNVLSFSHRSFQSEISRSRPSRQAPCPELIAFFNQEKFEVGTVLKARHSEAPSDLRIYTSEIIQVLNKPKSKELLYTVRFLNDETRVCRKGELYPQSFMSAVPNVQNWVDKMDEKTLGLFMVDLPGPLAGSYNSHVSARLADFLYIGDKDASEDEELLRNLNISLVIRIHPDPITVRTCHIYEKLGIHFETIPIWDVVGLPMKDYFEVCTNDKSLDLCLWLSAFPSYLCACSFLLYFLSFLLFL